MATKGNQRRQTKACTPCAKLKIRCEFPPLGQKCNRCVRLRKECHDQAPGAHRNKRPRANREAEIQRLESIVNSMSQLVATATPPLSMQPTPASDLPPLLDSGTDFCVSPYDNNEGVSPIKMFVEEMAPMFPFVVISPDITPEQLQHDKPLVYRCLLMITSQNDLSRQMELGLMIGNDVGRLVGRKERTLARLQGIMLYIAWTHVHQHLDLGNLTPIHIAISLITEMRLDEPAQSKSKIGAGALRGIGNTEPPPVRTLEERRAYLGVLWMWTIMKNCFHDMVTPRFTRYTEECCQILKETREHPNDLYLVELIRLLRIVERIDANIYRDGLYETEEMTAPLSIAITVVGKEIEEELVLPSDFQPSLPVHEILLHLAQKMLQLHLYKLANEDTYFPPKSPYTTLRADLLVACHATTESLLQTFCELPDRLVLSLPYGYWGMIGHAIKIYSRLSEVRYGNWAPAVGHSHMFARLAQKFEDTNAAGQNMTPPRRLPEIYDLIISKLKDLEVRTQYVGNGGTVAADTFQDNDGIMDGIFFDLLDWL